MTATESNEAPIISIQNVWKFFGQLTALHDVSFDVQPGERVVIIGPSGSGKSTLLRSINRLEVIDKGTILVEGSDINAPENDINKIRQDLGMVFQSFNLFPHLFVRLSGNPKRQADKNAYDASPIKHIFHLCFD